MPIEDACPCGSGMEYGSCCGPYHRGKLPLSAQELMRSRYAAYAKNLPDYIIGTTHPSSPQYSADRLGWKRSLSEFSQTTDFQKLEIHEFHQQGAVATVAFTAYLQQEGQDATFTEKSYFEKIKGKWLYRGGQLEEGRAPNLVTTGQLRLLPIAYYGEPVLRQKAAPVEEVTDDVRKLVEEMIETMDACNGMGIAAPQVHHSIRLFVIRTPKEADGQVELGEPKVFLNPEISSPSEESWTAGEGCLSIPLVYGEVERPKEITVEYTDLDGNRKKERVSGWEAKVICHENDHINGVLFIDRLTPEERQEIKPLLQRLKKEFHEGTEM